MPLLSDVASALDMVLSEAVPVMAMVLLLALAALVASMPRISGDE